MNTESMEAMKEQVMDHLRERFGTLKEHAEHFSKQTVDEMVDKGEVIELSEDEQRMLDAYRQFRQRNMSGSFSWMMPEEPLEIVLPTDPVLIRDPREVSVL